MLVVERPKGAAFVVNRSKQCRYSFSDIIPKLRQSVSKPSNLMTSSVKRMSAEREQPAIASRGHWWVAASSLKKGYRGGGSKQPISVLKHIRCRNGFPDFRQLCHLPYVEYEKPDKS